MTGTSTSPALIFAERDFPCGYAPRSILLASHAEVLFVGSKEGTLTVVEPEGEGSDLAGFSGSTLTLRDGNGALRSPIRALCQWGEQDLLVGLSDGSVSKVDWRTGCAGWQWRPAGIGQPIRTIVRLDSSPRFAISVREGGVYHLSGESPRPERIEAFSALGLLDVRYLLPLQDPETPRSEAGSPTWLVVTGRGDLYLWAGSSDRAIEEVPDPWQDEGRPGLISDYGLMRSEDARKQGLGARAALLATDSAVYRLKLGPRGPGRLVFERLALPGLGGVATAVSYSEDRKYQYLWVADSWGDSHLFWAPLSGNSDADAEAFRRSGVLRARADVLVCFLWARKLDPGGPEKPDLLVAQARRNDRIVLGRYWDPRLPLEGEHEEERWTRYRRILSEGTWTGEERSASEKVEGLRIAAAGPTEGQPEDRWRENLRDADLWPAHAVLAELFERLGQSQTGRKVLFDALRSPGSELAKLLLKDRGEPAAPTITRLWTQCLLGVIHRSPGNQQVAYLGLLRWLRRRQEEMADLPELAAGLQRDIGFARKWGLVGEVNADREDLVRPIEIVTQQDHAARSNPALALERLTYEALLFHRSTNLLERYDKDVLRGRTAWDLSVLKMEERRMVAVSWMWGGVDLFEVRDEPGPPPDTRFHLLCRLPSTRERSQPPEPQPPVLQDKWGYSRAVHLGKIGETLVVVTAPAEERGQERVHLWELRRPPEPDGPWSAEVADSAEVPGGESLFSLHQLEEDWLVAGLRGIDGTARLASLEIEWGTGGPRPGSPRWKNRELAVIDLEPSATPPGPDGAAAGSSPGSRVQREAAYRRNRVWSLASERLSSGSAPEEGSRHRLVVGTEAGQIYRLDLIRGGAPKVRAERVASGLSSPVLCLAQRRKGPATSTGAKQQPGEPGSRIFAGCEDGSIVAFEELPTNEGDPPGFAVLWATREAGPIADLHHFEFPASEETLGMAVLAVTRQGRCVLLDDRDRVDEADAGNRPRRFPVPGSRFGRFALPDTAFASALWIDDFGVSEFSKRELGAYASLLSASGEGTVSLTSLHTPAKTALRKQRYLSILDLWRRVVEKGEDWRVGEAVFRASPVLSLIVVRLLLDPALPAEEDVSRAPAAIDAPPPGPLDEAFRAWWLPRHLRPLLEVFRRWPRWDHADARDAACSRVDDDIREVGEALEAALRRAWTLEDLDLFQEISALALKRANFDLFQLAGPRPPDPPSAVERRLEDLYREVYLAIERSLQLWLGAPHHKEAKARAVVAKHIVDGDTAWRLFHRAALDREARLGGAGSPGGPEAADEENEGPFEAILNRRITGIRELVHKRDGLVSLEALRAANLSLMRLCKRLVAKRSPDSESWRPRDQDQSATAELQEIDWSVFERYFERLTAAAERTLGARGEQSDALAHEHTRTFALAVCACPSAAIRIADRLAETRLIRNLDDPDDLSRRILRQLEVLDRIGIGAPRFAFELFALVTRVPDQEEAFNPIHPSALAKADEPAGKRTLAKTREAGDEPARKKKTLAEALEAGDEERVRHLVGVQNGEVLGFLQVLHHEVVRPFVELASQLATDAEEIDLSHGAFVRIFDALECLEEHRGPSGKDLYFHSHRFWKSAVERLRSVLEPEERELGAGSDKVRPEAVLVSPTVARWAGEMIRDLDRRESEGRIFVPEKAIFRRVLVHLERAARDFRGSAAVQKNIVRGILGHHLLEDLDEHVLELGEIAQALDPSMDLTIGSPSDARGDQAEASTARRFGTYLLRRSQSAEGIPKNLRVLQTLLASKIGGHAGGGGDGGPSMADLLSPYRDSPHGEHREYLRWRVEPTSEAGIRNLRLNETERSFLRLTLEELAQNQRKHSNLERPPPEAVEEYPGPSVAQSASGRGILLDFPFRSTGDREENFNRLGEIKKGRLQEPYAPRSDGQVASTGAGLYLANLAAAVVGWTLEIVDVRAPEGGTAIAILQFALTAPDGATESGPGAPPPRSTDHG